MKITKLYGLVAFTVLVGFASHNALGAPVITFYKKQGENNVDCRLTMGNGSINFRNSSNGCSNDDDYYFSISGAQDGVQFGVYNNPDCKTNESYATYKMGNGDAQRNIRITAVDASRNVSGNTLIHDSLRAGDTQSGGQLHGKVSCLKVWGATRGDPLSLLPKQ